MASYLQSYFQNSSMPKRLIQYALSRLDILDTEALGLDNLDIAWGKNTTLEFRDVGLQLKKLEALISLPLSFELVKAKVLLLRLTIPVDVYSSPIVVEIDGVEGQLRIKAKQDTNRSARRTDHDRVRKKAASSRTRPHNGRKGSDFAGNEDGEPVLPTANDLAASFLQAEPDEERAELEAALLSETQELGTSSVLSEDGDTPVGTGAALSLPNFMAKFLQGIGDRLQIKVHGIVFNLDIDMPNESPKPSGNLTDLVTVQFTVDNVDIEGVTQKLDAADERDESRPKLQLKEGKRLIHLSKLRGALITEANLFSTLARSSAISSPSITQSDAFGERRATFNSTSSDNSVNRAYDGTSSPQLESSLSSTRQSLTSSYRRTKDSGNLGASVITSDSGRFEDAPEDEDAANLRRSLQQSHSDMGDSILHDSRYLDEVTESQYLEEDDDDSLRGSISENLQGQQKTSPRLPSPITTPRASLLVATESEDLGSSSENSDEESPSNILLQSRTPAVHSRQRFSTARLSQSQISLDPELSASRTNVVEDKSSPEGEEDLVQSQLFSHEDAESMYMSAISQKLPTTKIPGGWDTQSSGSEGTLSPPESPITIKPTSEPRDNLEHALHAPPVAKREDIKAVPSSSIISVDQNVSSRQMSESPKTAQTEPSLPQSSSNVSENSTTSSDEYTRLTKQFFDLDQISIYVPGVLSNLSTKSPKSVEASMANSMFSGSFDRHGDAMPGAFSSYTPQRHGPQSEPARSTQPSTTEPARGAGDFLRVVEIIVGSLLIQSDMSIGRLAIRLVQVLLDAVKPDTSAIPTTNLGLDSGDTRIIFDAKDISIKFLERLEGTLGSARLASDARPLRADVLLQTTLTDLHVDAQQLNTEFKTSIALKKFVFGYAQENIVSFNAAMQMGASIKDLKASDGIDMSAKITSSDESTRCQIITLPMHVSIDLQRLDETFSWFGGLSSVLNMGSSIASNATITGSPIKQKPRGVSFETPIRPDDKSLVAQNKADVRIGGIILDMIGTECSIGVSTSAVKVVNRDEGIGVFIQKIRMSGPHLNRSNEDPAISVDVTATRIEFLPAPKDVDLDRLLSLITPSKAKYDQDDDILLGTLLRQRKQGSVLRLTMNNLQAQISRLHELSYLPELGEEVSRLATVAKYLPDDDRPGLLSLVMVKKFGASVDFNNKLGVIQLSSTDIEVAQITLPSLIAVSVGSVAARRNGSEELLGAATDPELREIRVRSPAIMARMIGDEMEPVVKIKLWNLKVEYRVSTLITLMGLGDNATAQDLSTSITASVVTLTDFARLKTPSRPLDTAPNATSPSKAMAFDIIIRDCIIGLNPLGLPSKVLVVLTEAHLEATLPKDQNASAAMDMSKASVLVIDNVAHITSAGQNDRPRRYSFDGGSTQVSDLCATGYVSVSYISSAKVIIHLTTSKEEERSIDVELRDDLFVLESCADSTQTLIAVLNGLAPPTPPSTELRFRTKVIPVKDLLASLSGDAFGTAEGDYSFDDDFGTGGSEGEYPDTEEDDLDFDSHFYLETGEDEYDMEDESGSLNSSRLTSRDTNDGVLLETLESPQEAQEHMKLDFNENHFGSESILEGTAHRWNSAKNTYDRSNATKVKKSPLKVCVRDVHVIWNLFDGYDWQHTRDTITKAVQDVESKAIEKRARNDRRPTFEQDFEEEETVIGDFLFNSIYIGIPANRDPRELSAAINQELNDNATETESIATTSLPSSPSRPGGSHRPKPKRLRLNRSKHHKITFELRGVCVDIVAFPPGSGETQSCVDIRVHDFEVFDHVPTSTWRKFATYMQDAGERETGANMIHIEILNVKPIPELAASEIVLTATVLPLRLHVDQDALDFITRFFEFKDDSAPTPGPPGDVPFIQRAEVNSIVVKLDFKPKRVDYAGLRSGHTTEFMNFLILDEADMVLRHTIIYGVSGFDKLGKCLNDIWMPDVKRNQLPGILAGLAPVRSLVNVGGGFRHLVVVPMREYKKDGRIVRSISKGAAAFAKTTGTELVKLGAKVAIGVQTVLQGAEGFLGPSTEELNTGSDGEDGEEDNKQISLYANQPVGVMQGLRGGYAGLQRDLLLARDAIIAVPGEVMEGGNAAGVLRAVRKHAPTVILRPAIGVAKAGGQILMGATNSLDPVNLQRADAKYKKY